MGQLSSKERIVLGPWHNGRDLLVIMREPTIDECIAAHRAFPNAITVDIMPDGTMIPHTFTVMCEQSPNAIAVVWIKSYEP